MRCPKCGYISFDHLEKCLKCNKDIETISNSLYGSTHNIKAPTFLHLPQVQPEKPSKQNNLFGEQSSGEMDDYEDEELGILVEEEDSDLEGEIGFAEAEQAGLGLSEEDEQEDEREIEIDFSQFEDADEPEVDLFNEDDAEEETQQEPVAERSMKIEMPAELSDISDLAPPGTGIDEELPPAGNPANPDFSDMALDDLDFDLGLDGLDDDEIKQSKTSDDPLLALDEIDFSETLAEIRSDTSKKQGNIDMDKDLDFNLDLGGLSIHNDL